MGPRECRKSAAFQRHFQNITAVRYRNYPIVDTCPILQPVDNSPSHPNNNNYENSSAIILAISIVCAVFSIIFTFILASIYCRRSRGDERSDFHQYSLCTEYSPPTYFHLDPLRVDDQRVYTYVSSNGKPKCSKTAHSACYHHTICSCQMICAPRPPGDLNVNRGRFYQGESNVFTGS
ncbi:hypothetical protein ACOME3_010013 [Neoechinorhynchus agilis]